MNIPVFDAHCDTIAEVEKNKCGIRRNRLHIDLERGRRFSPYAQVFAIFTRPVGALSAEMDYSKDWPVEVLVELSDNLLNLLLMEFDRNSDVLMLCKSAEDIKKAEECRKVAALVAIEGAELLGCSIENLKNAYSKGVRLVNLCWNFDNELCGAANGALKAGLTPKGAEFVKVMQDIGMAVDLSHASESAFWDVAEITSRPIFAGHSNSKAICNHPRNLTDEQFKAIVKLEGVAGLNLYPKFLCDKEWADIDDVIRHAEHFLGLGGEKAICLGGDLDGVEYLPKNMTGIESYEKIYEAMLKMNYSEDLVRDIFYNNLLNAMERVL